MAVNWDYVVPERKKSSKSDDDNPLGSPSLTLIVGGTGSGKSTTMANVLMALQKQHEFDSGMFVTSNNRDPILDTIEMPITTSPKMLDDYITELKQSKEGTNHVLVLDDIQGSPDFKIMANRSNFVNFMLSHRHYGEDKGKPGKNGTWVIMTAQTLKNSYSTQIRDQVKNMFLYYPRNPAHLRHYAEIAQDPVAMMRAMALVRARGNHAFLFLNKHNPERDRYFLGFNEELVDLN